VCNAGSGSIAAAATGSSSGSTAASGAGPTALTPALGLGLRGRSLSSRDSYGGGGRHVDLPPRRCATPPPLRAVAVPLDSQVLSVDGDFRLDVVKVQFKCNFVTSFGQELRIVGAAPELGGWDADKVRGLL
jgi:hypothetical protein